MAMSPVTKKRLLNNRNLLVGAVLVAFVALVALLSFVWTPGNPLLTDASVRLQGPSAAHWFGTDRLGRDVFSQVMVGARVTLWVGVVAVGIGAVLGIPAGIVAGVRGGWWSAFIMRGSDVLLAFPGLLLAIVFGAAFGAGTTTAMIALGIGAIPSFARLARAQTVQVMGSEYVQAAQAAGASSGRLAWCHALPNIAPTAVVQCSVTYGLAVLAEAGLSFLGLGTAPPTPSWGRMLQEAQSFLGTHDYLALAPGIAIAVAVLGFNLLGDGLRDALDPARRLRG
ncbi:MAG: ABC transporter permease [Cellulomonadaceae bacterium]|jgi:peptide/nickel transport system permease protein|nr:ABC transporter permease [Cellulomonadaceae bacterium]